MTTNLTKTLKKRFSPGDPVSLVEAAKAMAKSLPAVSASLTRLAQQDEFTKVRQRLWVRAGAPVDPYRLGSRVTSPYAFSYGSALALHGAAASERSELMVSSPHRFDSFEFEGVLYRHVHPWIEEGRARALVGAEFVWVTSPERTLVECVRVPANAGGAAELLRSASGLPELNPEEVLKWLDHYGDAGSAMRVGYLLQVSRRPDREVRILGTLEQRRPAFRAYFDPGKRRGKLVARWNLLVPPELLQMP